MKQQVVFRNDDLGYVDEFLDDFLAVFFEEKVPLTLCAIPARVYQNKQLRKLMIPYLKTGLFEIVQHGYAHIPRSERIEFCEEMNETDVERDLLIGKNILLNEFGEYFKSYYTPPWNHICSKFLPVVKKHLINALDIPMQIRLGRNTGKNIDEDYKFKTYEELVAEFDTHKEATVVGILIHHNLYKDRSDIDHLRKFIWHLKEKGVEFKTFSGINR